MHILEYATRNKLRFQSSRGELDLERLWEVPLRSRDGDNWNLNNIAVAANEAVEKAGKNFVDSTKTSEQVRREAVLEVVKYVIATKDAEEKAAALQAERKKEKEKLLLILAEKQDGKLSEMSEKELKRRIAELES